MDAPGPAGYAAGAVSDPAATIHREWEQRLRQVSLTAGMVLVVAALVPATVTGSDPRFLWQTAQAADELFLLVLIGATGLGALVVGTVRIPLTGRALAVLALGLPALTFQTVVMGLDARGGPGWQVVFTIAGLTLVATGSLARATYWGSLLARLVCTLGVLMTVVAHAAPVDGGRSVIGAAIESAGHAQGLTHVLWIATLVPLAAGLGGLLVWSSPGGPAHGQDLARLAIVALPLSVLLAAVTRAAIHGPEPLLADLFGQVTAAVVVGAWVALTAHGGSWLLRRAETAA
jgi:hypothetical protein